MKGVGVSSIPIVLVDLDGVLVEFTRGFGRLAREVLLRDFPAISTGERAAGWETGALYPDIRGADRDRVWGAAWTSSSFWRTLPPLEPPLQLERLGHLPCIKYYVTRRRGFKVHEQTQGWLQEHCGDPAPTVLVLAPHQVRGPLVPMLGVTHALDDQPENLVNLLTYAGDRAEVWMRAWPHNDYLRVANYGAINDQRLHIAESLKDFLDAIERAL